MLLKRRRFARNEPHAAHSSAGAEVKERPIMFSGPMVRAILEGHKTQADIVVDQGIKNTAWYRWQYSKDKAISLCPYGIPGDRLWVKEAWVAPSICNKKMPRYLPSNTPIWYPGENQLVPLLFDGGRRRHARYMPRWASRLTLEVTDVSLEKLQQIVWVITFMRVEG